MSPGEVVILNGLLPAMHYESADVTAVIFRCIKAPLNSITKAKCQVYNKLCFQARSHFIITNSSPSENI